ncbi:MAG: dTDP-4-amino-4,6-dideoxygalactose transaminase [Bdellovibrionales bacterium]
MNTEMGVEPQPIHEPSNGSILLSAPSIGPREKAYVAQALSSGLISGDQAFTRRCHAWMENVLGACKALLTTSGTHALEMAALLAEVKPGDEVILPSFTFSSTATAFVLRGARLVFVDIRPDTMNLDENLIESAITARTRVIVPMHYAGVSCEMDVIMAIANKHGLRVIEDAAHAILGTYKGRHLGTIGDFGCFSFHESKNLSAGEGGAIAIREGVHADRAEIVREKGTNRTQFFRGEVDKYTWKDIGSSYLPSELNAACLLAQFERAYEMNERRLQIWNRYLREFGDLARKGEMELPVVPSGCQHNAHLFYIKVRDLATRTRLHGFLKEHGIRSAFHYVPLHSSPAGLRFGQFHGEDRFTTSGSERLLRLPLFADLRDADQSRVCQAVNDFFRL